MKKIELERNRGRPFQMAFVYFADGKSLMLTGDYLSNRNYISRINQPAFIKSTIYPSTSPPYPMYDISIPWTIQLKNGFGISVMKLLNSDIKISPMKSFTFDSIDMVLNISRRSHYAVVMVTGYIPVIERRVICIFRRLPNAFPDKLRTALINHSTWEG